MIDVERRGDVDVVWLDRPPVNALDLDLLHALTVVVDTLERPAVITGRGSSFSAGADLHAVLERGDEYAAAFVRGLTDAFGALFRHPRPIVAAVNGHAIAGGAVIACCCDHRVAAEGDGRIGVSELAVGVPFPLTALEVVRHTVPPQHLQAAVLLASTFGPARALELGFVDEVTPADRVVDRAVAVAEQLGRVPAASFAMVKADLRRPIVERLDRDAASHDVAVVAAWQSSEVHDAIRAFLDRTVGRRG